VSNATRTLAADGERGSGTRYQRRVAASNRAGMATVGRGVIVAAEAVADRAGVGDGAVTAGVHEVTASATVNTCARYLKDR
jgi:hypothetical protein